MGPVRRIRRIFSLRDFLTNSIYFSKQGRSYGDINDELWVTSIAMAVLIFILIALALFYILYEKCQKKREYTVNAWVQPVWDTATCWQTHRRPPDFLYWATLLPPSWVTSCTKHLQKQRPISWWRVTLSFTKNYVCYLVQIWKLPIAVLEMWHRLLIKLLLKCYFLVFCFYFCTFIVFPINEP